MATTNKKARPFSEDFSEGGKTQQHFKDSCDVNNIIAHYTATGIDPHADRLKSQRFGFATSKTYAETARANAEINSAFAALPSEIRSEFGNDPGAWLDSLATPTPTDDVIVAPEAPGEASELPPEEPVNQQVTTD